MDGTDNERGQERSGILLNTLRRAGKDEQANRESFPPQRLLEPLNKAGRQFEDRQLKEIVLH